MRGRIPVAQRAGGGTGGGAGRAKLRFDTCATRAPCVRALGCAQISRFVKFDRTGVRGWHRAKERESLSYAHSILPRVPDVCALGFPCLQILGLLIDVKIGNLVTYHHEVASIPLGEVSRESCSVSK